MGLVCWRQPSCSGPRPVLAELKNRGSWGENQGREHPLEMWDNGVTLGISPHPHSCYLQAAIVTLRDLVKGDVQEGDLMVTQDFITAEDLKRGGE